MDKKSRELVVPNNSQAMFRALSSKTFRAFINHPLNDFDVSFQDDEMAGEQYRVKQWFSIRVILPPRGQLGKT